MAVWHLIVSSLSVEALIYPLGFHIAYYSSSYLGIVLCEGLIYGNNCAVILEVKIYNLGI